MRTARGRIIPTGWPAPHGADPGRSMAAKYDVAVIGGGIVGMATAMALVEADGRSLVVLEAEDTLAAHQSGHNSGVIHSGLYYKPGSLKARTCRAGRDALYQFCIEERLPYRRRGKLGGATRAGERSGERGVGGEGR